MAAAAVRYAKALWWAAAEAKAVDPVATAAATLRVALLDNAASMAFLRDPLVDAARKLTVLDAVLTKLELDKKVAALLTNFLQVLADNGRLNLLVEALVAFQRLADADAGRVTAQVTSAAALTAAQQREIEAWVLAFDKNAKSVLLEETVDADLLAGLKIQVNSTLLDASAAGRLAQLKQSLQI